MKRKILKLFFVYSYVTLLAYVGSEESLRLAKYAKAKQNGTSGTIKIESLWKSTFRNFKEYWNMV